jgi:hypothetical protein
MAKRTVMESCVRATLWLSVPFNLGAAYLFAAPGSALGRLVGMPPEAPVIYLGLTAWLVALFGFTYLWLVLQHELQRPLLAMLAIGKCGVFVVACGLATWANLEPRLVGLAAVDMALGFFWIIWLTRPAPTPTNVVRA